MTKCKQCKKNLPKNAAHNRKFCNKVCCAKWHYDQKPYDERIKKAQHLHHKKNDLIAYDDELIDCKESPTGKAYVGIAKKPLMPNANGFGYEGVKLQSENRELIMCYECGKWVRTISGHLKAHKMKTAEYKERYGFNKSTGLVPDVVSNILADQFNESRAKNPDKFKPKPPINNTHIPNRGTRETQNKKGTCPEQLKVAIINYAKRFHRLPNSKSHRDGFKDYSAIRRRFGGMNPALKELGLPTKHPAGNYIEYIFPDGTVHYKSREEPYDLVYAMMIKKCPILTK